jgi:hypothetical protein
MSSAICSAPNQDSDRDIERERAAWQWARENAIVWTPAKSEIIDLPAGSWWRRDAA